MKARSLTDMVVMTVRANDDVAFSITIQRPSVVVVDRPFLDELPQACDVCVWVLRTSSASCINDDDDARGHLGVDERVLGEDVVELDYLEGCRGEARGFKSSLGGLHGEQEEYKAVEDRSERSVGDSLSLSSWLR